MTTPPPPGWYPDPWSPESVAPGMLTLRYWDGRQWTSHTHAAPQTRIPAPAPYVGFGSPGTHPAAMPAVRSGPTTPDGQRLAGWWIRAGAQAIDGIFASILNTLLTLPAQISIWRDEQRLGREMTRRLSAGDHHVTSWYLHRSFDLYRDHVWVYLVTSAVIMVGATVFLHLKGGTPGQLLAGLRTRRRDAPGHLSWGRAAARVALYPVGSSILTVAVVMTGPWVLVAVCAGLAFVWGLIDPLWAAWDAKRQTLHDKVVGTNVVTIR